MFALQVRWSGMERYSSIEELVSCCLASDNSDAWEEFVRRFHRPIATSVLRTAARLGDGSSETVDDLIQETYLKLCADNCRLLRDFQQHHPDAFAGYVKVVAANVTRDYFKALRTKKRGTGRQEQIQDATLSEAVEPHSALPSEIERAVLIREVASHLEVCLKGPDKERNSQIFWLHYRAGLTARAIAELPEIGVSAKGIESILSRVTRQLRERMTSSEAAERDETRGATEGFLPA